MLTPKRAATSLAGWPRSATCLTAAILNSSVYRFPLIPSPCGQHYGSGVSMIVVTIHFDEDIDHTHRVVLGHVVVQKLRQQRALPTVLAFNKALHFAPVLMRYWLNVYRARSVYLTLRFYTA